MSENFCDLTGKVAIVTGSSRGLGQYMARALARAGADLVVTSRTLDSLKTVREEIETIGRKALPQKLDVRDYDSIQNMVEAAHDQCPRIVVEGVSRFFVGFRAFGELYYAELVG